MNLAGLPVSQKTPPFISQKLRRFARGQDCAMRLLGICNRDPETTVLCHGAGDGAVHLGYFETKEEAIASRTGAMAVLDYHANHGRRSQ